MKLDMGVCKQKQFNKSSVPGNVYDVILTMQVDDGNSKYKGVGKLEVRLLSNNYIIIVMHVACNGQWKYTTVASDTHLHQLHLL